MQVKRNGQETVELNIAKKARQHQTAPLLACRDPEPDHKQEQVQGYGQEVWATNGYNKQLLACRDLTLTMSMCSYLPAEPQGA